MDTHSHSLTFYGLTTCVHCKYTREFLENHDQDFEMCYVDQLEGEERSKALGLLRKYNPKLSFPTLVIDDGKEVIVGFKPEELSKALGLEQ